MTTLQDSRSPDSKIDQVVGKVMFQANIIVSLARSNQYRDLLSEASQIASSYDFSAGRQKLQAMGLASFDNAELEHQEAVFQLLGFTYRTLPEPQAFFLWWSLLNTGDSDRGSYMETRRDTMAPFSSESPQFHAHWINPTSEAESESKQHDNDDLPIYTSRLFEKGQECGEVLRRTSSMLSMDPPRFQVTIVFGACSGTGIGRTKRVAGHLAAKQVCHKLKIAI